MAEKYELDRWAAVVCNGFTAVNVMSSGNVEELGWDYTEMELDPTGTCGLFDGMLLDWDDDTPAERRDHEAYFPDAFTVGARILADDWDHELGNDEVRSRCFAIIEDADQFTDHDTARDWLCESTMADFSEVEARTFFQNLTLMDSEEIAKLDGRPIIPSAGADECRAAVLAFNERMVPRRRELGLGDTAVVGKTKKSEATSKVVPMKISMICRGDREKAGTFTVKPGTYEPIMGIYDPINGCGGTAGIELDTDFDIDPRDIKYTMMEPRGGKWESDRIDLYTPQDCFGFSEPFAGRIEYSEKKPKIAAKAKPDPADLGRRASVAAGATIRDGVDGGGIKL